MKASMGRVAENKGEAGMLKTGTSREKKEQEPVI